MTKKRRRPDRASPPAGGGPLARAWARLQARLPARLSAWAAVQARDPLNWVAVAVVLVWGAVALWWRPIGDYGVETDFYGDFVPNARLWFQGHPGLMKGFRGPLYYLVLGTGMQLMDAFVFAKLLAAVCAGVTVRLVGALLRGLFGRTWAVAGVLFLAGNAVFMDAAYRAGTDLVYFALYTATLTVLLRRDGAGVRSWLAAGALAGLAYLTRYNGTSLVLIGLVVAAVAVRPWRRAGLCAIAFAAAWLVVVSPWLGYLWHQTGDPFWNRTYTLIAEDVYGPHAVDANTWQLADRVGFRSLADVARLDPGRFWGDMAGNVVGHVRRDVQLLVQPVWAGLSLLGLILGWRAWRGRRVMAFALAGLLTFLVLVPVFYNQRFMLTLLIWWAAAFGGLVHATVCWLDRRLVRRRVGRQGPADAGGPSPAAVRGVLGVAALAVVVVSAVGLHRARDPGDGPEMPVVLLDLARQARASGWTFDDTTPVCARKPQIGYLLGAPWVMTGLGEDASVLAAKGVHYLLISGIEVYFKPFLARVLQDAARGQAPPGMEQIAFSRLRTRSGELQAAALYAIPAAQPWQRPEPERPRPPSPPPPGLGRIDYLRVKLLRWYLTWAPDEPLLPLLDTISARGREHELVRMTEGDVHLVDRDLDGAARLYTEQLAREPGHPGLLLRLALVHDLQGDQAAYARVMADYLATLPEAAPPDLAALTNTAVKYFQHNEIFSAAPLFAYVLAQVPADSQPELIRLLGYSLLSLRYTERARALLTHYLDLVPGHAEVEAVLKRDARFQDDQE